MYTHETALEVYRKKRLFMHVYWTLNFLREQSFC